MNERILKQKQISELLSNCASYSPVWDFKTAINCALQRAKDLGTGGGTRQTDVKVAAECTLTLLRLDEILVTVHLQLALVHLVQLELLKGLKKSLRLSIVL